MYIANKNNVLVLTDTEVELLKDFVDTHLEMMLDNRDEDEPFIKDCIEVIAKIRSVI